MIYLTKYERKKTKYRRDELLKLKNQEKRECVKTFIRNVQEEKKFKTEGKEQKNIYKSNN